MRAMRRDGGRILGGALGVVLLRFGRDGRRILGGALGVVLLLFGMGAACCASTPPVKRDSAPPVRRDSAPSVKRGHTAVVPGRRLVEVTRAALEQGRPRAETDGVRVSWELAREPGDAVVPAGTQRLQAVLPAFSDRASTILVVVEIAVNGRVVRRQSVCWRVHRTVDGWRLRHAVRRGDPLAEGDLEPCPVEVTRFGRDGVVTARQAVGAVAVRDLAAGTVLVRGLIRDATLVHRGERVRLRTWAGAVEVEDTGEALGDAALGQTVRVRNPVSRAVVSGRVTGPQEVEVEGR